MFFCSGCSRCIFLDFVGHCFASTLCKVFEPEQSWSLAPFCGKATCRAVKTGEAEKARTVLAEEVIDCGPLVDLEKTTGCELLQAADDITEKEFPECCPQYDCVKGAEIVYVGAGEQGSPRSSS
jgi:hypothetical protein